jgi:uncharacterized protein (DUF2147 family)
MMRTKCMIALLALLPVAAFAQQGSPVGRWKTIDDETGKPKSVVEITKAANGTLQGRVVEILQSDRGPNPKCDKCKGTNKDKPVKGMTILWGLRESGNAWAGGTILDPANGKTYKSKAKMIDANRFGVSGCLAFICREQTWVRE